jgi:hypothetical protein
METNLNIKSTYYPGGKKVVYTHTQQVIKESKDTFLNLKRLFCGLFKK